MEHHEPVIVRSTLLSQQPRENSGLIAVTSVLVLFAVSVLSWKEGEHLYRVLAAEPTRVFAKEEYWRLFTAMGVHADMAHLLGNAVLFGFFAYLLYGYFGFRVFPVLVSFLGCLVNSASLLTYPKGTWLVGASGLVYLMAGFWLTMYVSIERRLSIKRRLLRSIGVALIVLVPTALQPSVSYRTHAIGFVVGVVAGIIWFLLNRKEIRDAETVELDEPYEVH